MEAAREWVERLSGLVKYWTKRERQDAREQLHVDGRASVRPVTHQAQLHRLPAFQARELEEAAAAGSEVDNPYLYGAFNFCARRGCRQDVLKHGRLYYKRSHRDAPFMDRFFVLAGDHLVGFETVKRNMQQRPVPITYHRRLKTIRMRDVYIVTGAACADYLRTGSGQATFDPSNDQSSLARIYMDGLVSVDDPADCTFMLWKQAAVGNAAPLGRGGSVYVFQARSRLERDQWWVPVSPRRGAMNENAADTR